MRQKRSSRTTAEQVFACSMAGRIEAEQGSSRNAEQQGTRRQTQASGAEQNRTSGGNNKCNCNGRAPTLINGGAANNKRYTNAANAPNANGNQGSTANGSKALSLCSRLCAVTPTYNNHLHQVTAENAEHRGARSQQQGVHHHRIK